MTDNRINKPEWYKELKSFPFKVDGFSSELKAKVSGIAETTAKTRKTKLSPHVIYFSMLACSVFIFIFLSTFAQNEYPLPSQSVGGKGGVIVEPFPGGGFTAGTPAGCWWNIHIPYYRIKGNTVNIVGTHSDTGTTVEEVPPTIILESMSYEDITRIPSKFALPLAGEWHFKIFINGDQIDAVTIRVPDSSWQVSSTFKSGSFEMSGVKNRLGFIHPGFKAGKWNKYMWHFWGKPEELSGKLEIVAVKRNTVQLIPIFEGRLTPGKLNGADAALPTSMMLPEPGLWRIMAYINGDLYGSVVVKAE